MRLPLSWLRDFVAVRAEPEEIATRLGTSGFEIEGILRPGAPDRGDNHGCFVVGRVVEFGKHPNADRLRLCAIDTGDAELRQIVCGASNFAAGDTVVVALPGALLPGADAPLKQAKLRGEISNGMMLSERELGLSDDHDGIIVLPSGGGLEAGTLLRDLVELDEVVLDISVESNRGDCLSVYGLAREVAVLFGLDLAPMPGAHQPAGRGSDEGFPRVVIDAPDRCSRFMTRSFADVTVGASPFRVRQRLAAAGMRPISNVVDATNYVMHELGNPLHVYDADRVAGDRLVARLAQAGEQIRTLDGKDRGLDGDTLVIADVDGPSGVAGVMGGERSEITSESTRVLLEAACFERGGIQRTSKAMGLRTDGSNRWEKGVSPHLAPHALNRATELIAEWSGAEVIGEPQDVHGDLPEPSTVLLRKKRPAEVLGLDIEAERAVAILEGLGYAPEDHGEEWACTVPWWRWLDATREIDLVEELARVHGLDRVPSDLPRIRAGHGGLTSSQRLRRRVEDHLAGMGLQEAITLSLVDPDDRRRFGFPDTEPIALRNPLSADLSELRESLLPGLLQVLLRNRAVGTRDLQMFEVGRTYQPGGDDGLAIESERLGILVAGAFGGDSWRGSGPSADFGTVVAILDALLVRMGVQARRVAGAGDPCLHPGRSAALLCGDVAIGELGELHPSIALELGIDGPVALAQLDLAALAACEPGISLFHGLSSFPPVRQDIAILVPVGTQAAELIETAREAGGEPLVDVQVFDVFADSERLGPDCISVALHLVFQVGDRTLTEDEATAIRTAIVEALRERHRAELRA